MLLYEHIEASEHTQSPIGSLPRGADGRAPLTKAIGTKKELVWVSRLLGFEIFLVVEPPFYPALAAE